LNTTSDRDACDRGGDVGDDGDLATPAIERFRRIDGQIQRLGIKGTKALFDEERIDEG